MRTAVTAQKLCAEVLIKDVLKQAFSLCLNKDDRDDKCHIYIFIRCRSKTIKMTDYRPVSQQDSSQRIQVHWMRGHRHTLFQRSGRWTSRTRSFASLPIENQLPRIPCSSQYGTKACGRAPDPRTAWVD